MPTCAPRSIPPTLTSEAAAKAALLNELRRLKCISRHTTLASEFVLGTSGVRADLAIFNSGLTAVEIKTERDTLRRLEGQLQAYRSYCDKIILVLASKHIESSRLAKLDDAEIWEIGTDGSVEFVRAAISDRSCRNSTCDLLNQAECLHLERAVKLGNIDRNAECIDNIAVSIVERRFQETSIGFWSNIGRRKISPEDLALLSRFRPRREMAAQRASFQNSIWDAWEMQARELFGERHGLDLAA